MADMRAIPESVAVICGGGSIPGAVAEAIRKGGRRPVMLAIKGWAEPKIVEAYAHHWIALGQAGRLLRLAHAENCGKAVLIGSLVRPRLSQIRLDWETIRMIPRIAQSFVGGDDRLLSGIAKLIEEGGVKIIAVHDVAPEILMPLGGLGRNTPSERDLRDIARGLAVIAAMGPFDVGQAAVVANNHVLAVEAAEGTDNLLLRIAEMRRAGRVANASGTGVLVKAPKPGQDRRFDLPSIGARTIENTARAGLAGIAVVAGGTLVAEPAEVIAATDRSGLFCIGVAEAPRQ